MSTPSDLSPTAAPATGHDLAVVIPAYKARFLAAGLESWARQTDQRFRVYVADDGSPEDIAAVVEPFRNRLDLVYQRFDDNLGATSLVRHWHRAIALSQEPWIWLFSDDDMVTPDVVAAFHRGRISHPDEACLWRLHLDGVDEEGRPDPNLRYPEYPPSENWRSSLARMLDVERATALSIQNVVFPRVVYDEAGGFEDLPRGWGSDVVTWPRFARRAGWRTVPGGRVKYRVSAQSITGEAAIGGRGWHGWVEATCRSLGILRRDCAQAGEPIEDSEVLRWLQCVSRPMHRPTTRRIRRQLREGLPLIWPEAEDDLLRRYYQQHFSYPAEWKARWQHRVRTWHHQCRLAYHRLRGRRP